jgi:hypothetical protein
MIRQQALEPDSDQEERERLRETLAALQHAQRSGDPTGMIARAIGLIGEQLSTVEVRPHRGLVDYDQRLHG